MLELEVKFKQLFELKDEFESWFLLKMFNLASILLLGLGEIGREIFKMLAYLPFDSLLVVMFLVGILLNCDNIHCLKDLLFFLAINFSSLDS